MEAAAGTLSSDLILHKELLNVLLSLTGEECRSDRIGLTVTSLCTWLCPCLELNWMHSVLLGLFRLRCLCPNSGSFLFVAETRDPETYSDLSSDGFRKLNTDWTAHLSSQRGAP